MSDSIESESVKDTSRLADEALGDRFASADPTSTGWYVDPYAVHEFRWFSCGRATPLVRDGNVTSSDDPPEGLFDGPLIAADEVPLRFETTRAGDDPDARIGPVQIVYNSSM